MQTLVPAEAAPWAAVAVQHLPATLAAWPWALVEFWARDCLFSRLLKPTRVALAQRAAPGLVLLRCEIQVDDPGPAAWGADAIPVLVLFNHGQRRCRWVGDMHWSLVLRGTSRHMGTPAQAVAPEGAA